MTADSVLAAAREAAVQCPAGRLPALYLTFLFELAGLGLSPDEAATVKAKLERICGLWQ